ncbi:MAG: malate synthase A [Sphingomonas sp.]
MLDLEVAEQPATATASGITGASEILTDEALTFLGALHRRFDARRKALLAARTERQRAFDAGALPDFPPETANIRAGDWTVAPIPQDLMDRRVEITGPTDRKMVINALNSGAQCFMADFEDATAPTWTNIVEGQINLRDRWLGRLRFQDPASGRHYALGETPAVLIVRPRGWHLDERHITVDGERMSGGLVDFGLYLFHNAERARAAGSGPYFYLPKLESHHEAALWNDVFAFAEATLGLERGAIKATVLIETITAAFEMDEILHALRANVVGLNCGRWDYIFSTMKRLGRRADRLTPDRSVMTMDQAFLAAYSLKLVETCHRRGAFAMGGMAAQIPVKGDEAANEAAFAKVRADKQREAANGHDGTWVAHPALVSVARDAFDRRHQLDRKIESGVTREDMLRIHEGPRTEAGMRENIRVGVQYIAAWLGGRGAVPLYNLMEDAATAEICRTQLWQWLKFEAPLQDGRRATRQIFDTLLAEEMAVLPPAPRIAEARDLFKSLVLADTPEEFLTIPAYASIG